MIRLSLHLHVIAPTRAVRAVDVILRKGSGGALQLEFDIDAALESVRVPPADSPGFSDGLWRHTCFELFAAAADGSYREFNFSPSSRFAIYDFTGYRTEKSPMAPPQPPSIEVLHGGLSAIVRVPDELLIWDQRPALRFGVAAVIEERGGALSYWAVHHAGAKPDFHDRDGFVVSLRPGEGTEEHEFEIRH